MHNAEAAPLDPVPVPDLSRLCRACGAEEGAVFHRALSVPANSCLLIPTREEALAFPRGEIALAFCSRCGFVFNAAFDRRLTEYSARYEETQGFSPTFRAFQDALASYLVERHSLRGRTVVEIGCGKGEFLTRLCELGAGRGIGFDPAYIGERNRSAAAERVEVVRDFYSEKYAHLMGDLIVCKMTLEHIDFPRQFLTSIRRSIGDRTGTPVYFQVPDATRIFRECAFEDIYYEHCSYFTPGSLVRLFAGCGFALRTLELGFEGQYLMIEAEAVEGGADALVDDLPLWRADIGAFGERFARREASWRRRLAEWREQGRTAVLWGSGSKGVAFLGTVGEGADIPCVVDINPHRQMHFMAGTGEPIVAPEALREIRPDVVVVMNPVYREEIAAELQSLGLAPELVAV